MGKRVAVMDLGTNTFHLLIAEKNEEDVKELCHLENSARLGEGGMQNGEIKLQAFERGLIAMHEFKKAIDEYCPDVVKAIGTSALRSAKNDADFIDQVKKETGIEIESIDGETEAGYIFRGVKSTGLLNDKKALILDIGGGSIEFIIADTKTIYWKHSYEIGAARLMQRFHLSDPIHLNEIQNLQTYLDEVLPELYEQIKLHEVKYIIGSSGSFETFAVLAERKNGSHYDLHTNPTYLFDPDKLNEVLNEVITSTHKEREINKNIVAVRVDMIVVAAVVTQYLIEKIHIAKVATSVYSLKEGVLAEMLE